MQEADTAGNGEGTSVPVNPIPVQPLEPSLALVGEGREPGEPQNELPSGTEVPDPNRIRIKKKRRKKGKGKRSSRRRDPRRAAIRLWGTISLVAIIVFGGGYYLYSYVVEAGEKRDRALTEMAVYVKKIERMETAAQRVYIAEGKIIDLHPEPPQGSQLLPPEIGHAGNLVMLRLHTPAGLAENWDLTLRDEMRNVVTKMTVSSPGKDTQLITLTGLREGVYEITGKVRSKQQQPPTKYVFAIK